MFADGSLGVRCIWWLLQCSHLMVPLCLGVPLPPGPRVAKNRFAFDPEKLHLKLLFLREFRLGFAHGQAMIVLVLSRDAPIRQKALCMCPIRWCIDDWEGA